MFDIGFENGVDPELAAKIKADNGSDGYWVTTYSRPVIVPNSRVELLEAQGYQTKADQSYIQIPGGKRIRTSRRYSIEEQREDERDPKTGQKLYPGRIFRAQNLRVPTVDEAMEATSHVGIIPPFMVNEASRTLTSEQWGDLFFANYDITWRGLLRDRIPKATQSSVMRSAIVAYLTP